MDGPAGLARLLVLAVIFVNGWTDAPNAIATAVGSGALTFRRGVALAAVCNFAGAAVACLCFPAVADTVGGLAAFADPRSTVVALNAALLSIVLWAVAAWRFGLPTSESHALLAGLSGGALAGRTHRPDRGQRWAAALTALLHGVQDGQKFLALLLLVEGLDGGASPSRLGLALLTAGVMALGTALGGRPIVEKVGTELADLSPAEGLAADLGAGAVLLVCSALGLPVSTTHAKVAAVCGAGRGASKTVMGQMAGAWVLTFPACGGIAFLLARLMTG